jgi:hypothetical protein
MNPAGRVRCNMRAQIKLCAVIATQTGSPPLLNGSRRPPSHLRRRGQVPGPLASVAGRGAYKL